MIRVLVVDDDFRVARVHASYCERVPGFEVVGTTHTAADALRLAAETAPDLVLLDEYLPDRPGSSVIGEIGAAVIVISAADDAATVRQAIARGAVNYLVKPFAPSVLADRLVAFERFHRSLHGDRQLDQQAVDRAMRMLHEGDLTGSALPKGRSAVTAEAVREALRSSGEPMTAQAIADAVGVSRATAQRYLADLARAGRVQLGLRYGATGRPEHRYEWLGGTDHA
ncbi:response regulator [Oryzihumus leptocrescens]|uniref:Transcriptional regulatory protein n=1 Tax=Oryzihumus leptocrescens TaxID=297536 RepID=A0A542ZFQ6_9MICO|nr:two-component system CitB family response regulator [Oryzihumus leptocrescens]